MKGVVLGLALLPALAGSLTLVALANDASASSTCVVSDVPGQGDVELDAAQSANARIIVGVAAQAELPARAAVVAVAAAKQETDLRNVPYGDRDSLGLFQQRPSQGWGSPRQLLDPVYASANFYSHLVAVPRWRQLPLTVAAQTVQRSAFPNRYAQWKPLASRVVAGVSGQDPQAMSCELDDEGAPSGGGSGGYPPQKLGPDGLTPRARTAMDAVIQRFGVHDVGGFCPGGCTSGHVQGSDHYTGHAVDFMLLPMNERNQHLGDLLASWLVANADAYGVKYVIWNERIWSAQRADEGWRPYEHPSGSDNPTLAHQDHMHLSVY